MDRVMPRTSLTRWLVVALPGAGALVMLGVLALGWAQTQRSAEMVLRGEATLLMERLNREVRRQPAPLTDEALARIVAGEARAGLLFAAAIRPSGEVVATSSAPPAELATVSDLRPGDFRRAGTRAWARGQSQPDRQARGDGERPPPRDDARPPRDDRPPRPDDGPDDGARPRQGDRATSVSLLILFEPRLAGEIDRAARATLLVGVLGAAGLLLLGLLALRLIRRNEDALRSLEKERRLAALGTMSAVVAHELRNPLAALKGHAQLLVEALEPLPREKAQAQRVVDGAWRLERLSASLLELARTGELAREAVSPAALVRAGVAPLDADRIRIDDSRAPSTWSLDPLRFQQVVTNLADNALQASPGQPVEVRVTGEQGRLVVEFRDHGPGVPRTDRERIFEPFVTTRAKGVGLGLAVARQVVELHGGTLSIADAPGGGACFRVEIPAT
jgi:two-component system sensor histidine kinase HydH